MKKIVSLLMSILLVICAMPTITAFATSEEVPEGYIGIYDIEDLYCIRYDLDKNYILMADIDMTEATAEGGLYDSGYGWKPIDTGETSFTGIFDGNGHTISGMVIRGSYGNYTGLFGKVSNGEIKNITLANVTISNTNSSIYTGCIAAYAINEKFENISVSFDMNSTGEYSGGIVGYIAGASEITNGKIIGTISNPKTYAGGVLGFSYGSGDNGVIVSDMSVNIAIESNSYSNSAYLGGLGGYCGYTKISKATTTGTLNQNGDKITYYQISKYVAGIVGYLQYGSINNCRNNCTVKNILKRTSSTYDDILYLYSSGICSYLFNSNLINCSNTGNVTAISDGCRYNFSANYYSYNKIVNYTGGIIGASGGNVIRNCFNVGDISTIEKNTARVYSYSGGIVGDNGDDIIEKCYNVGKITSNYNDVYSVSVVYCGGIAGNGDVSDCINLGTISSMYTSEVSGITGSGAMSNNYYLFGTANQGMSGTADTADTAVSLSVAQSRLQKFYFNLDFDNTWFFDISTGIEHPQLMSNPESNFEHEHSYLKETTPPTCKEKGYTTYTCSCGYSYVADYTETVSHTPELINDVEPTETESGYSGDYVCSVCHDTISTGRVIPATGHVHTYAEWTTAIEAGCTTSGLEYSLCTGCSMISFRKIDVKNHVDEDKNGICDTCEESLSAGCKHKYEMVVADATCTEKGTVTMTCSLCKDTITAEIPAKGHNYVDFVVAPTCEEDGYTRHICSLCGDEHTDTPVKATGHSMRVQKITPTCTENGCDIHVCSKCGYNYFDNETLKLNHSPILVNAKEATQGKDGYTGDVICERCEEMLKKGEVIHSHAVRSVTIDDISMNYKNTTTITPKIEADDGVTYTVEYTTSNPKVATVDNDGKVYAAKRGSGSATITCTVTDQYGNVVTDECNVNVSLTFVQKLIVYVLFGWIWY